MSFQQRVGGVPVHVPLDGPKRAPPPNKMRKGLHACFFVVGTPRNGCVPCEFPLKPIRKGEPAQKKKHMGVDQKLRDVWDGH